MGNFHDLKAIIGVLKKERIFIPRYKLTQSSKRLFYISGDTDDYAKLHSNHFGGFNGKWSSYSRRIWIEPLIEYAQFTLVWTHSILMGLISRPTT